MLEKIDEALFGGVDIVQLRSKTLSDAELFKIGEAIRKITAKHRKLFFVNDRVDLMLALQADGVHLGQDDLPINIARKLMKNYPGLIGKSTHSLAQALQAEKEGADYIGFGPIFKTPTKPTYQPVGLRLIPHLNKKIKIPLVCIGGINSQNVDRVIRAGGKRVAVVRAVFDQSNIRRAAQKLKERMCHEF